MKCNVFFDKYYLPLTYMAQLKVIKVRLKNLEPGHDTPSIRIKYYSRRGKSPINLGSRRITQYFLTEDRAVNGLETGQTL